MNIDLTKLDEPFVLENKTNEIVAIRHYRVNFVEKLLPGQTIEITPKFAEELAYYKKIQEDLETENAQDNPVKYISILNNWLDRNRWPEYIITLGNEIGTDKVVDEFHIGNEIIPETEYNVTTYESLNRFETATVGVYIPVNTQDYVLIIEDHPSQTEYYILKGNDVTNQDHKNHVM